MDSQESKHMIYKTNQHLSHKAQMTMLLLPLLQWHSPLETSIILGNMQRKRRGWPAAMWIDSITVVIGGAPSVEGSDWGQIILEKV